MWWVPTQALCGGGADWVNRRYTCTATDKTTWETIMNLWKDQTISTTIFSLLIVSHSMNMIHMQRPWQRLWRGCLLKVVCIHCTALSDTAGCPVIEQSGWASTYNPVNGLPQARETSSEYQNLAFYNEWDRTQREGESREHNKSAPLNQIIKINRWLMKEQIKFMGKKTAKHSQIQASLFSVFAGFLLWWQ